MQSTSNVTPQPLEFDWGTQSALIAGSQAVSNPASRADRRQNISIATHDLELARKEIAEAKALSLEAMREIIQQVALDPLHRTELDQTRMELYERHLIGCGFLRFAGLESIRGFVLVSNDPNRRVNPRPKQISHIEKLKMSIMESKNDWRYPIIISVSESLLDDKVMKELHAHPPFQQFSNPPLFTLNNIGPEEQQLRREIFWEHELSAPDERFLTREEMDHKKLRMIELMEKRPRATLVNGNHRIHAMLDLAQSFEPIREQVIQLQKDLAQNKIAERREEIQEELNEKLAEMQAEMNRHTWQVIVFKDTTPDELLNELARNHESAPQLAPGPKERAWMHACEIEAIYHRIRSMHPNETHAESMDRCHFELQRRSKNPGVSEESEQPTGELSTAKGKGKAKAAGTKIKGSSEGSEMYQRITTEPVLLEMLLHTKACMWAYTMLLNRSQVSVMLQPTGGAFAARFWMALDLLQKLANTPRNAAFAGVDNILQSTQADIFEGHAEVVPFWRELHKVQEKIPIGLQFYGDELSAEFEKCWVEHFGIKKSEDSEFTDQDWDRADVVCKIRKIYDNWGQILETTYEQPAVIKLGQNARIYARLPLYDHPQFERAEYGIPDLDTSDCFFVRATLPTKGIATQWARLSQELEGNEAAIELQEFLIDRHKLMWVKGSGDAATKPNANWYHSGRGTLHIVLAFAQNDTLGCMASRLDGVSTISQLRAMGLLAESPGSGVTNRIGWRDIYTWASGRDLAHWPHRVWWVVGWQAV
ncbi:hypothetical protein CTheo_8592 [Ceratobasidium theobromae]|uniref:Uncharacterized protein n=1 Tax=Ceratobasidium theobromae TaxID=1582974 RepID=A0A5N5Q8G7_9AGAM|nr:hypothetical protein CTheo_8592 [Ceratobasidium theobromae]